jgi:S-adenosylmethionine:tRNA ribosyltransferase-isomerase
MAIKVRDEELQIKKESSQFILKFPTSSEDIYSFLERVGEIPLPPYIKRKAEDYDEDYYQTVYGDTYGSIAAPTAGLHFSSELLKKLETKGTKIYKLILHIGEATFLPPTQEELKRGELKEEFYSIPNSLEEEVSKKRGKLIACGTSTVRALESFASSHKLSGETNLFISPGYEFKLVDGMITNFHLPLSPTYILTAAFAGLEFLKEAYSEGLKRNFYFGSYGDSMLIL